MFSYWWSGIPYIECQEQYKGKYKLGWSPHWLSPLPKRITMDFHCLLGGSGTWMQLLVQIQLQPNSTVTWNECHSYSTASGIIMTPDSASSHPTPKNECSSHSTYTRKLNSHIHLSSHSTYTRKLNTLMHIQLSSYLTYTRKQKILLFNSHSIDEHVITRENAWAFQTEENVYTWVAIGSTLLSRGRTTLVCECRAVMWRTESD